MQEQNFVLITQQGKVPQLKRPMATTATAIIKLLDECLERTEASMETRTVCIVDEYGELDVYGELDFRARFKEPPTRPDALMPHYPCR